jgi:hypothetical protein
VNENDLNAQMHLMSTEDTTIHLPEPTLETLPDKNKIFEEYISLWRRQRYVTTATTIQFQYGHRTTAYSIRGQSLSVILPLNPKMLLPLVIASMSHTSGCG